MVIWFIKTLKFTRRRNALTLGTMMLIAGSVALVLDDPNDPFNYVGSGLFMMNVTAVIVKQETIPITDFSASH